MAETQGNEDYLICFSFPLCRKHPSELLVRIDPGDVATSPSPYLTTAKHNFLPRPHHPPLVQRLLFLQLSQLSGNPTQKNTLRKDQSIMFRRRWSGLPEDPVFPTDLEELGCVEYLALSSSFALQLLVSFVNKIWLDNQEHTGRVAPSYHQWQLTTMLQLLCRAQVG